MQTLAAIEPVNALSLLGDDSWQSLPAGETAEFCRDIGLFGLLVKRDGVPAGYAVARSRPAAIMVSNIEGDLPACRLLVKRLIMQAGERTVNVWCPASSRSLQRLLKRNHFVETFISDFGKPPAYLYRLRPYGLS